MVEGTTGEMLLQVHTKEGGREGGREGGKEGGREGGKEGGREGGRDRGYNYVLSCFIMPISLSTALRSKELILNCASVLSLRYPTYIAGNYH